MARTQVPGRQIADGATGQGIGRSDLDTITPGESVVRKVLVGPGLIQTSTGQDAGTGDTILSLGQLNARTPGSSAATAQNTDGIVYMNFAGANTYTIPAHSTGTADFATEQVINLIQTGAGKTEIIAGSGVTFITPGSRFARIQGSALTLKRLGNTDTWVVFGDTDDAVGSSGGAVAQKFFKATTGDGSGGQFGYSDGQIFGRVTLANVIVNAGGFTLNDNIVTLPVAGLYDVRATFRFVDGTTSNRSFGIGVGTVQADSPNFYWHDQGGQRTTVTYSNIFSWNAGDQVRLFIYNDDYSGISYAASSLILHYLG